MRLGEKEQLGTFDIKLLSICIQKLNIKWGFFSNHLYYLRSVKLIKIWLRTIQRSEVDNNFRVHE